MRTGILGGTFNPIHFGHINPTREVAEKLKLDKVLFLPAYLPPHKPKGKIISAEHRINMIKLAIEEYPHFELSLKEIDRKGISYSVDTLTNLMKNRHKGVFFFLIGIDAFLEIENWKNVTQLINSCNFAIIKRGNFSFSGLWDTLERYLSEKFENLQFYCKEIEPESGLKCIKAASSPCFLIPIETNSVNISSTQIRENIKHGKSIKGMVPEKVNIYIEKNRLYR